MAIPRNLTQTTASDLAALIEEQVMEGPYLDYKRDLPRLDGSGRHDLLADISAFANSSGGDVVYGIDEDGEGKASAITPSGANADEETRRIQDVLMNGLEPRVPGVQVHPVTVQGGFVLIVRVPQSWAGPHRVKSNQHFFIREGVRKRQLDIPEIRGLFLRSEHQAQKVREFRTDRLGKIISGEPSHLLLAGSVLIIHLIPTQAALGLVQIDPVTYVNDRTLPTLGTTVPRARLNVDGALGIENQWEARGTRAYSLFFRNGFFETVYVLQQREVSGRFLLPSSKYEVDLIKLIERFRTELKDLGVGQEMTCMLSLTEATSVMLAVDRNRFDVEDHQGIFDRKTLVLPDVLLPAELPANQALRPLFDLVWQSAGFEGSFNYNAAGQWEPQR
jgi:hypothetical protein